MSSNSVFNTSIPRPYLDRRSGDERPVLISGGAGFVGTNLAHRLLQDGRRVLIFDNLARPGVEGNWRWLRQTHGERVVRLHGDVRDAHAVREAVSQASQVFHFAAQVAVTSSLLDPLQDFDINARGTLNLLEALRAQKVAPPLLFTSTNKVYGALKDVALRLKDQRYEPEDAYVRTHGINEGRRLDFHSPYGCSKGAADQYVLDYARTFGLRATVFRMSCIYGPHQFGTEDQGWVAHFLRQARAGRPITVYGDGMQVRDVLFVDDLVDALLVAQDDIAVLSGHAFNLGGGPQSTLSLLELLDVIAELRGEKPLVSFADWRSGDQRYYVSDTRAFCAVTGWRPRVGVRQGLERLHDWMQSTAHQNTSHQTMNVAQAVSA